MCVWEGGGGVHVESVNCQLLQYVISSYAILIKKKTQVSVYIAYVAIVFCPIQHILEAL